MPVTIWNQPSHSAGDYGSSLLLNIFKGKRFDFPKSIFAEHDALRFIIANKPNALIVDFFAGSGTTLHAVNLLNAEDEGKRRCVMVTNNEVSAEEEKKLKRAGYHPGQDEWDKWGIARYVNWPRTKCSILGVDVNNIPINGAYQTYLKQEKERERTIKQITLIDDPSSMKTAQKKELVALCCQGKLPQSLVKADSKFIVSEDHPCTILFDINYTEEWLEALEDQDQVAEIYIVTRNNEAYKKAKAAVQELLGNIIEEEPVLRPMSDGFAANAQFFKLSFLDKKAIAMDMQFKELLTILWMKAGAVGECPSIEAGEIEDYYIFPENKMAILKEEDAYRAFKKAMKEHDDISTVFIITDSDSDFREMSADFSGKKCYQLYRDYLDNFSINYERN
jgi:adenine-specific DNA-methyltransferase